MNRDKAPVRVVIAIIERHDAFLIAERPEDKPAAGLWEFPGGKVEAGESDRQALLRELDEELGIDLSRDPFTPFAQAQNGHLTLQFYHTRLTHDIAPHGREGQQWRWVARAHLRDYPFPDSNSDVVDALMQAH